MGKLGILVYIALCLAMAGGVYFLGVHQPTQQATNAEAVQGTVTATEVAVTGGEEKLEKYEPVVTYRYSYDGREYTNDVYYLVGGHYNTRSKAENDLDGYAAGESLTVYVDPDDPSQSFLRKGSVGLLPWAIMAGLGFMAFLGVLGLVGAVVDSDYVVVD